jgi:hypothetical protein
MRRVFEAIATLGVLLAIAGSSYGQGGTTSTLNGVVVDTSGAIIPGANVTAKQTATGVSSETVSNAEGVFSFPALNTGTYTVTVALQGFKQYVANNVVLTSGAGANVRAVLEVGAVEETVTVSSQSAIVQTQNPTISTTITTNQVIRLPVTSRSAMDFVAMLPGVATPNGNRQSTINGLPRGTINITLDGVNIQDNTLRSTDGFFAIVSPRLDAVEEVTLQTAAQGADSGGQGAVQVKFVTRSGSNDFIGSGYYYYRNDKLNANTWLNNRDGNAKPVLLQNQIGARLGGPIKQNKIFFFGNYEEFRQPSDQSRTRTLLNPSAQSGIYTYTSGGVTRSVNVLQLAAANGFTSTSDPTIAKMLQDIRDSTGIAGGLKTNDLNTDSLTFNNHVDTRNWFPTVRVDVNVTNDHRFTSSFNYQKYNSFPDTLNNRDPAFPGFPSAAGQYSQRLSFSNWLRSTFSSNMVNEARLGYSGAPVEFFPEFSTSMFTGSTANSNGVLLSFPSVGASLTSPSQSAVPQSRNATAIVGEDIVTWLKGAHSITLGGSATQYTVWMKNQTLIPTANLGFANSDPAIAMFNTANLPGASTTQLTAAENLYGLLTGRIVSFTGEARIDENGQYGYLSPSLQRARMREMDTFIQDQWRVRPNVTVNAGLRYGLQFPFYPQNNSYTFAGMTEICGVSGVAADGTCNLFTPGVVAPKTALPQYTAGTEAYHIDKNNFAPSVGAVWTPEKREGWLGKLMGEDGDFVVRGGYARNYSRPGLNDFTGPYSSNTGLTLSLSRAPTSFLLFRDAASTAPIAFNPNPPYPLTPSLTSSVNGFFQDIQVTSADSVSVGIQRALNRNTSIEIRYVGTWSHDVWQTQNYNEFDIFDNGFLAEFRKAQANLAANIAGGRGATFAYTGLPGTSPLPIFLAYFNGVNAASAGDATKYTGTNWTSSANQAFLAALNPNPFAFACLSASACSNTTRQNGFIGNATFRANAAAAGLPANFFIVNPDTLAGANVTNSLGSTRYNSLQLELRRRFASGFQAQASYVFGHQYSMNLLTLRAPEVELRNTGDPGDITHTFKLNMVYDLPVGEGHRLESGSGVVNRVISGWQLGVATIVRSGTLLDFGNVRLVGMTPEDLEKSFQLRFDDAGRHVYMLPQDIIDNTIAAFNVSATSATGYAGTPPTGRYMAPANGPDCIELDSAANYGRCASRSLVVTGPVFRQTDIKFTKLTKIAGRTSFEFGVNVLNVFNQANFLPRTNEVGGTNVQANYEVNALSGTNTSRLIEILTRVNW